MYSSYSDCKSNFQFFRFSHWFSHHGHVCDC